MGIRKYGEGHWLEIASLIKTKNRSQVRDRARTNERKMDIFGWLKESISIVK